jgi:hypothetical protein
MLPSRHTLIALTLFATLMMLPVTQVAAQTAGLDGKVFVTDIGFKGKEVHERGDILTFKDGKFHSSNCDQYGYNKGDYKTTAQGDATTFETETYSEKYGRLAWKGTVRGDQIEGNFTMFPKPGFFNRNPAPIEHWFKGQPKG